MFLLFCTLLLTAGAMAEDAISLTFRNELPELVHVFYEEEPSEDGEEGYREPQGDPIPASGGEMTVNTFPGHKFSYDYGNKRHWIEAPEGREDAFVVLLGDNHEIRVSCTTSTGGGTEKDQPLEIRVVPWWSPRGAARFLDLVRAGYYDGVALNRVVPRFLTQFGIGADFQLRTEMRANSIPDDPIPPPPDGKIPFEPGMLSYAGSGPNSRTTEVFVVMPGTPESQLEHFGTNPWETPFAIVDGDVEDSPVARWHAYGDMPPWGEGPDPQKIYPEDGYEYLAREFPQMDYIGSCKVVDLDGVSVEEEL